MNTFVFILKDVGRYSDVATLFDNWCNGRFEVGFIDLDYNALDSGGPMQFLLEEMCHGNVDNAGASGIQGVARISKLDVTYNTMNDLYGKARKIKDASCRRRRLRRAIDLCNTVQTPFIDLRRAVLLQEPPSVPTLTGGGGGGAREAAVIDPSDERLATMSLREQTALLSRQWHWRRARDLFDRMRALPGVKVEFFTEPIIVAGEGAVVVLRVHLSSPLLSEFFIYRAGPGLPSLERVQDPTGIASCDNDDGGSCLLVGFRNRLTHYEVYVYTSTTKTWSTRKLDLSPGIRAIRPQKVINLGRGLLGWVDLWHGILIFNARDEQSQIQYVPLPEPMPLNKESFRPSNRSESCPMLFRDVICSSSGEIKFVELEQRQRKIQPIPQELEDVRQESKEDVCDRDVLDDSYLMSCAHMDDLPKEETPSFVGDGWRAVTWSRLISSNCWQKGYVIDSDDMQSTYEVLTSTQRDKGVEMLRFRDLFSVFPTLSLNGAGDLLYLKSTVKFKDLNGWVSSIDIGKKTIKVLKPYCNGRHIPFVQMFRSCVLCHHLTVLPETDSEQLVQALKDDELDNGPENIGRFIETSSNENHPKTIAAVKISHEMVSCTSWLAFCESCQTSSELEFPTEFFIVRQCLRNTAGYHMAQTSCFENDPRATANTTPRHPENQFTQHGYEQRENDFILSAPNFVRWHRPPFSAGGTLPPPPPTQQPSAFGTLPPPHPSQQFSACGTMLPPSSSQPFCSSVRSLAMQTFATPGPILPGPPVTPMQWPVFVSPQHQLSACAVWPQAGTVQQELPPHIPFRAHQSLAAVLIVLAAAAVAASASESEFKQTPVADMPADPRVPLLGRFAVLVYSLNRNRRLTYAGVSLVDQHPDKGGVRYQMVVTAADAGGGAAAPYRAVVWGIPETHAWMLQEFNRIN
ncbi:hypothetical protein OsI_10214 [Oryza sativa Indica Group]|uniref:DUF1618 domain-containing protein n=1 Tax=Oryza sativa subsp. indica TaxID=39946 RepID=B8APB8_ORYSI|nr:hypothetical protein OsI_10214 [Oryza sativa Indica Group]